jgi:transcriptional adapter 3
MSQPLLPYAVPPKLHSPLLHETPELIPPTDELEAVQNELRQLKQKSLERAKKADGDLKAIEFAIKKLREKEKGKAKAIPKVKREPSCKCCCAICATVVITMC